MKDNIAIIAGSSRSQSTTHKLALAIQGHLQNQTSGQIFLPDFTQYDIPFFNQKPIDNNNPSSFQSQIIQAFSQSKIIFLLSPEYNWTISAEILNLFHQFGSAKYAAMWQNKVFAFAGVSSGRGGRFPAADMIRVVGKIVGFLNLQSIISTHTFESQFTNQALNPDGTPQQNPEFQQGLQNFINYQLQYLKPQGQFQ